MRVFTMAGCLGDARGTMRNARGGTNDLCQRREKICGDGRRKPRSEKAREVGFRAVSSPGERAFQNRASIGEQEIQPALTGRAGSLRRRSRNSFARQILGARGVGRVSGVADRRLSQLLPGDRSAGCAGRTFPASDRERRGRTERYVPHSVYPVLRLNAHCAGIII